MLAVFLNAEECGCCGVGGTDEMHVPPNVNTQLATAIANAPANETSPQVNVTVDLTTALPPPRGSGSSAVMPYIFYNGALQSVSSLPSGAVALPVHCSNLPMHESRRQGSTPGTTIIRQVGAVHLFAHVLVSRGLPRLQVCVFSSESSSCRACNHGVCCRVADDAAVHGGGGLVPPHRSCACRKRPGTNALCSPIAVARQRFLFISCHDQATLPQLYVRHVVLLMSVITGGESLESEVPLSGW